MTNRQTRRRYRKSADRRVWVFSELNHDLTPEQMAKVLVSAALEQARREKEAQQAQPQPEAKPLAASPSEDSDEVRP